jgi:hypothetical protein
MQGRTARDERPCLRCLARTWPHHSTSDGPAGQVLGCRLAFAYPILFGKGVQAPLRRVPVVPAKRPPSRKRGAGTHSDTETRWTPACAGVTAIDLGLSRRVPVMPAKSLPARKRGRGTHSDTETGWTHPYAGDGDTNFGQFVAKTAAYPFPFWLLRGILREQSSTGVLGSCAQRSTIPTRLAHRVRNSTNIIPPRQTVFERLAELAPVLLAIGDWQGGWCLAGTHPSPLPSCPL